MNDQEFYAKNGRWPTSSEKDEMTKVKKEVKETVKPVESKKKKGR